MPFSTLSTSFLCSTLRLRCVGPHPPSTTCATSAAASCIDYVLASDCIACTIEGLPVEPCVLWAPHSAVVFRVAARPRSVTQSCLMAPSPFPAVDPSFLDLDGHLFGGTLAPRGCQCGRG